MSRNIKVCKKCSKFYVYESTVDAMNFLYSCSLCTKEEDELAIIPKDCKYKLEHVVIKESNI